MHDIGKNLDDIIHTNNGYTVHNIGIKQPIQAIIDKWRETGADAIGMSGLLVKSVNVMEENLKELNTLGLAPRVLLGGAALTRHYCEGHLRGVYQGEVFYGKDAFDGLRTMDLIVQGRTPELQREVEERQGKRSKAEELIVKTRAEKLARAESPPTRSGPRVRSDVRQDAPIPTPPFYGTRVVEGIDLDEVFGFLNHVALVRGQWQVKKGALSDAQYDAMIEDTIRPVIRRWQDACREQRILQPKVCYAYFPCNSDGDDLIIWDPDEFQGGGGASRSPASRRLREVERFSFPRQGDKRRLCISDFFRPVDSGEVDVIGMSCVTVGPRATEEAQRLFKANDYTNYLYLHGLSVETAEALAEFWHKRMRQELGIGNEDSPRVRELFTQHYRGSRYSFGYPACPAMSDQEKLFRLLRPERIGCVLTENWQIDPEQSTSAIVVHHPEAKYFNV